MASPINNVVYRGISRPYAAATIPSRFERRDTAFRAQGQFIYIDRHAPFSFGPCCD